MKKKLRVDYTRAILSHALHRREPKPKPPTLKSILSDCHRQIDEAAKARKGSVNIYTWGMNNASLDIFFKKIVPMLRADGYRVTEVTPPPNDMGAGCQEMCISW